MKIRNRLKKPHREGMFYEREESKIDRPECPSTHKEDNHNGW